MAKKFTNVETYVIIIFLAILLITGLGYVGLETLSNDNANLDNDSIEYIAQLNGIDMSDYNASATDIERSILINDNTSQGNPKDQALDFLFAKEKGFGVEVVIKGIHTLPEVIIIDMLRFELNDWEWIIGILNWLYSILIIVAIVYFARGILS